jgi:hypothetical protein
MDGKYTLFGLRTKLLIMLDLGNKSPDTIAGLHVQVVNEREFQLVHRLATFTGLPVGRKLQNFMADFFGDAEYQAVAYGSSTSISNKLLSDVDMMVFVNDELTITPEL